MGNWEIERLGNWEIGRLGNWEIGRLGNWEISLKNKLHYCSSTVIILKKVPGGSYILQKSPEKQEGALATGRKILLKLRKKRDGQA